MKKYFAVFIAALTMIQCTDDHLAEGPCPTPATIKDLRDIDGCNLFSN